MSSSGGMGAMLAMTLGLLPAPLLVAGEILPAVPVETQAQPSSTTATYGDWLVRCNLQPDGSELCETQQGMRVADRQGLLAQIVFGRVRAGDPLRLVVQLPLGIWLPAGATLYLDASSKQGLSAPFTICTQACIANMIVPADVLADLQAAAGPGRLEFVDGAQRRVALPVSFKGLKAALEASASR